VLRSNDSAESSAATGPGDVTRLLDAARAGDRAALDRLFATVYAELHALARHQLAGRAAGATLSTTVLVHEAYLKLVGGAIVDYRDRRHFFALAARAMRQIIIDGARRARAQKRGGEMIRIVLDPSRIASGTSAEADAAELIALDDALTALENLSERLARIVELRFFAGLSVEETGDVLELSPRTVKRDWRKARAFLFDALAGAHASRSHA
jgi:RNA polymerase sigma factor (TIGR02999 family)